MKGTLVSLSIGAMLLVAPAVEAAVESLLDVVPTGSPMVLFIADIPTSLEEWRASPAAGLWNDPQIRTFLAPLREEIEIDRWNKMAREETGHDLDEIVAMFNGDAVVFIDRLEVVLTPGEEDADLSIALVAAVGDSGPAIEKIWLDLESRSAEEAEDGDHDADEEVVYETREFRGVDLHLERTYEGDDVTMEAGWAVVDGVLVDAYPVDNLERIVDAILDGGVDEPVDTGDNFATINRHVRDADAWFFMDMDAWSPIITELIEVGAAAAREADTPLPFDPGVMVDALGIDALQAVFLTSEQDGAVTAATFGVTYTENKGLVKLLAYGPDEAPRPAFIPGGSDAFSVSSFDFAESWSAVVEIMNGINPALMAMASMQIQSASQKAGVELDLERDILDNLDGELVTIQNYHGVTGDDLASLELAQDQVFAMGIKQRTGIENAIESLKTLAGRGSDLFSAREFAGRSVYTLGVPKAEGQTGNQLSYVVTDSHVLISMGSPTTLEDVLLALEGTGDSVWKQPAVRDALAVLPVGSTVIQIQDLSAFGAVLFPVVVALDEIDLADGEDSSFRICDPEAMPDDDLIGRYFSSAVTGAWKDDRSMIFRSWSLPAATE